MFWNFSNCTRLSLVPINHELNSGLCDTITITITITTTIAIVVIIIIIIIIFIIIKLFLSWK